MDLVEVDDVDGVRTAVVRFASDASSLQFVLVPVAHLGERALAAAVRQVHDHYQDQEQEQRLAVVNWVESMPAVARALGELGYAPVETTWIPVFSWLPDQTPADETPPRASAGAARASPVRRART